MTGSPPMRCPSCGTEIRAGGAFCPSCGAAVPSRAASPPPPPSAASQGKRGGKPAWFIALTAVVSIVFVYLFIEHLPGGDHPVIAEQPAVEGAATGGHADQVPVTATVQGESLSIPLPDVVAKRIVEFSYDNGTVVVPLLAFVTGEGKIVTAFRMCEPCNSTKYAIDGERLSCGNCETQWSLNTLEGLQGSCQKFPPQPFPSVVEGDRVVMSLGTIRGWKIRL